MGRVAGHIRSNVVAYLALFCALGGTAYAAVQLQNNSVRSRHIAKGQVKTSDVARAAINSSRVKDRSLRRQDLAAGVIPASGSGSGLDADTIDGLNSNDLAQVVFRKSVAWNPVGIGAGLCLDLNTQAEAVFQPGDTLVVGTTGQVETQLQVTGTRLGSSLQAVACNNGASSISDVEAFTVDFMVLR